VSRDECGRSGRARDVALARLCVNRMARTYQANRVNRQRSKEGPARRSPRRQSPRATERVYNAWCEALYFLSQCPLVARISETSVWNLAFCLFTRLPREDLWPKSAGTRRGHPFHGRRVRRHVQDLADLRGQRGQGKRLGNELYAVV